MLAPLLSPSHSLSFHPLTLSFPLTRNLFSLLFLSVCNSFYPYPVILSVFLSLFIPSSSLFSLSLSLSEKERKREWCPSLLLWLPSNPSSTQHPSIATWWKSSLDSRVNEFAITIFHVDVTTYSLVDFGIPDDISLPLCLTRQSSTPFFPPFSRVRPRRRRSSSVGFSRLPFHCWLSTRASCLFPCSRLSASLALPGLAGSLAVSPPWQIPFVDDERLLDQVFINRC